MPEDNEIRCPISSFVDSVGRMISGEGPEDCEETDTTIGSEVEFLCRDCAMENGAEWPPGHLATLHTGECGVCGEERSLSNVNDWIWADNDTQAVWD